MNKEREICTAYHQHLYFTLNCIKLIMLEQSKQRKDVTESEIQQLLGLFSFKK